MKWWQTRKRDADLERELQSDLELEEEEQREGGLSEEEARYAALRAFGNPASRPRHFRIHANRTYRRHGPNDANDPEQTLARGTMDDSSAPITVVEALIACA